MSACRTQLCHGGGPPCAASAPHAPYVLHCSRAVPAPGTGPMRSAAPAPHATTHRPHRLLPATITAQEGATCQSVCPVRTVQGGHWGRVQATPAGGTDRSASAAGDAFCSAARACGQELAPQLTRSLPSSRSPHRTRHIDAPAASGSPVRGSPVGPAWSTCFPGRAPPLDRAPNRTDALLPRKPGGSRLPAAPWTARRGARRNPGLRRSARPPPHTPAPAPTYHHRHDAAAHAHPRRDRRPRQARVGAEGAAAQPVAPRHPPRAARRALLSARVVGLVASWRA